MPTIEIPAGTKAIEVVKEEVQKPASKQTEESHTPTESESRASGLGWMPEDKWVEAGHDASDWKPAKVFLEHGDMIGRIRTQSKEIADMKQALLFANNQNTQVYEKGYQQAITELKQAKRKALEAGDLGKADEFDDRIEATKEQLQTVRNQNAALLRTIPQQSAVDPEHVEWVARNPWYNTSSTLAAAADRMAQDFIKEKNGQTTPTEVRVYVEKAMREEFPEKTAPNRPKAAPSPDGESRSTTGRGSTGSSLDSVLQRVKSSMTDEQRSIMKTMLKSTGMTEKKYLEMYNS